MVRDSFGDLRRDYEGPPLDPSALPRDPTALLQQWLREAAAAGVGEPNGMALATCDAGGQPHCRVVLLKQIDARGLVFFTNRDSDKGRQLLANARAAATFWWQAPQNRQVRVLGVVAPTDDATSDEYFAARPRDAQFASAASPQSLVVADRAELERRVDELRRRVGDGPVLRPSHWGGYALQPTSVEFWQGRLARLHDRLRWVRDGAAWRVERLAP